MCAQILIRAQSSSRGFLLCTRVEGHKFALKLSSQGILSFCRGSLVVVFFMLNVVAWERGTNGNESSLR